MAGPFKKGCTPWNKGIATGIKPTNIMPIGTKKVDSYGFTLIKIGGSGRWEKDWVLLHKYLWEIECGAIPKNCVIMFRDGNKSNITIKNLKLVTRQDVMKKNTIANLPKELQDTIHIKGVLTRRINGKLRD